jgi:hypothetical protein
MVGPYGTIKKPNIGIEPMTFALQVRCSATKLVRCAVDKCISFMKHTHGTTHEDSPL